MFIWGKIFSIGDWKKKTYNLLGVIICIILNLFVLGFALTIFGYRENETNIYSKFFLLNGFINSMLGTYICARSLFVFKLFARKKEASMANDKIKELKLHSRIKAIINYLDSITYTCWKDLFALQLYLIITGGIFTCLGFCLLNN